ncbi:hypothetical protein [Paenibacillus naphthalenovorans]|uniref:Uncharacterized protein n=1 Tax=Paenibacillus naphthalenovorans TaxID=162209 RepID=A0A0U2UJQ9_9BACL|nr:hypothetical protein [Paenibacillus naphthalenovorans]ALS22161.1 hypothetical protein IJ22_17870 [Paenibacillus naphthalenovorans]
MDKQKSANYTYKLFYEDIEDGFKEKEAATLESENPLDEKYLEYKCSMYADMYGLGYVTWREV